MGKVKKKKFSAPKPCPTGLPSVEQCESEIELEGNIDTSSATLQLVIEKLQSPNEENRECACMTIANLVSHQGALQALLKLNVVKILGPLVLDHSWDIRHRALGALRNLSIDGGSTVCIEMVDRDILTPVLALVQQFGGGDQFSETETTRRKSMICETYSHAFYLLQNLCTNSDQAVTTSSRENIVPVLCTILDSSCSTQELKIATVEFLHTVTEDNSTFSKPELKECIQRIIQETTQTSSVVLMRMLATGVLINLEGGDISTSHADYVLPLVQTLSNVLSINVVAMIPLVNQSKSDDKKTTETIEDTNAEAVSATETIKLSDIDNMLRAQKIALEIVANLCCSDDDNWEDLNSSESSCEDYNDVTMVTGDDDDDMTDDNIDNKLCVSTEIHSAYVSCCIVQKVLEVAQPLNPEIVSSLNDEIQIIKRFESKQCHGLLCLNNLITTLDVDSLGGIEQLYNIWTGLLQLSTTKNCLENQELLESSTGVLRAVIQKIAEVDPSKFQDIQGSELQFMYEMSTKCQWSDVRVNTIRIISTVGCILAQNKTPHPLLKDIGVLFLQVVCQDTDLWIIAEALDSIFDVFAEDHTDPVLKEIELVDKLKTVSSALKAKVHKNRKSLGEHYPIITSARTNLVRFIKYKMSHSK
ncbi:ribosomal large subunit biogenesis [Mactra antiquata]